MRTRHIVQKVMTIEELNKIVDEITTNHTDYKTTPRELLEAFNAYRRTSGKVGYIDEYLKNNNLQTTPDYHKVWWLDERIILQEIPADKPLVGEQKKKHLSNEERVQRIIHRVSSLKVRLEKLFNEDADLSAFGSITSSVQGLPALLSNNEIKDNMKVLIQDRLTDLENSISRIESNIKNKHKPNLQKIRKSIKEFSKNLHAVSFTTGTFFNLGYLNGNLVAIGANGSGKTSLAENIKRFFGLDCVVIGAQKLLLIPKFNSVLDVESSQKQLREQQAKNKSLKQPLVYDSNESDLRSSIADDVADEFSSVINSLLAAHNLAIHKFANTVSSDSLIRREPTILEKVFDLWHQIMPQRTLKCEDGINIMVHSDESGSYPAYQLSDGEKVTLYLIADVMQAPEKSYIIVDEPETYLHKSIVNKLWDLLEAERGDDGCIFIYLTHNVEFAESRHAKKVWIKSYNTKEDLGWDIQEIPNDTDIPQSLLLELLGSRRPVLFCEGVKEKTTYSDAQIYEVLYPQFTIKPVNSCKDVINYTKAFNTIQGTCNAYGIVDSDFRSEAQIQQLEVNNVFVTNVSEIENLFLCEKFIRNFATWLHEDPDKIYKFMQEKIKKDFIEKMESQVANYISSKIDYTFKEQHFIKANNKSEIVTHFNEFCDKIKIDDWVKEREEYLHSIQEDYNMILTVFNNKGLKCHANSAFKISNFPERSFKYLRESKVAQEALKEILPHQLSEIS